MPLRHSLKQDQYKPFSVSTVTYKHGKQFQRHSKNILIPTII
nr:MAG TPA: hypothetical protein [Caudoviricetes sp.]